MVHEAGRSVQLLPVPISTLGGWHPDAHRAVCSVATTIAARGMSTFSSAKRILFQRHAALLVTNMLFASCQVYCRAFEEELTVPLKYLSLFITQVNFLGEAGERNFLILLFPERNFLMLLFATLSARQGCGMWLKIHGICWRRHGPPKFSRYSGMLQAAGTGFNLLPVPLSTLGGWRPDAHRASCSVATTISARGLSTLSRARSIFFQQHATLLVTNNALCLMPGLMSDIWGEALFVRSTKQ